MCTASHRWDPCQYDLWREYGRDFNSSRNMFMAASILMIAISVNFFRKNFGGFRKMYYFCTRLTVVRGIAQLV